MHMRAVEFMQNWVDAHVVVDRYPIHKGLIAAALIERCHEDLSAAGISPWEVSLHTAMSVETFVIDAMEQWPRMDLAIKMPARDRKPVMH